MVRGHSRVHERSFSYQWPLSARARPDGAETPLAALRERVLDFVDLGGHYEIAVVQAVDAVGP